jgi:hypothetical protein
MEGEIKGVSWDLNGAEWCHEVQDLKMGSLMDGVERLLTVTSSSICDPYKERSLFFPTFPFLTALVENVYHCCVDK